MENKLNEINEHNLSIPICKCPYNKSFVIQASRIVVILLGSLGICFLSVWLAILYIIYSLVFNYVVWPVIHCQHCYYKMTKTSRDKESDKSIKVFLAVNEWKESYLDKHVACGKKYGKNLFILWFGPIVLIIISFFINFNLIALMSLIGIVASLGGMGYFMTKVVCEKCAIKEECFSSF